MMDGPFKFCSVGQPVRRKEDRRLLTGRGRFSDDFNIDGQAYAVMVRSPYPHALIKGFDIEAARAAPGILGVYTGADCAADGLGAIPHNPLPSTKFDLKLTGPDGSGVFVGPHALLPADKARHVGEAVTMVVAETCSMALDAAELVHIDFEELPFVIDAEKAMLPDAPAVWDEAPGNVFVDTYFGDKTATDEAFRNADHIISAKFHIGRVTGVPIEPRAALAQFDAESGRYTLYAGSGGAVRQKHELARVLGIGADEIRVVSYDVGGNFGTRNRVYVEFALVLWAARKLNRPVKFTAARSECFLSDYQGRDLTSEVELAVRSDGRFLALRSSNLSNAGARSVSLSPLGKGCGLITGSYDIPAASLRARAVFTNTVPTQAYRSSGRPEVTYSIERLVELAADRLGIDPVELRRRNLIPPEKMPYTNAVGMTYDSGTYEANLDSAIRLADWDGFAARREEAAARGRLLGRGLAHYVESSIGAPKERAEIRIQPSSRVDIVIGTQPSGQGHETSFAQVASDFLGVPIETIKIIFGDTDVVSVGGGSHSGRSMRHAGTVIAMAAKDLTDKGRRIAAAVFGTDTEMVRFDNGRFSVPGTNYNMGWFELAACLDEVDLPEKLASGLMTIADNEMHTPVFPNGCAICEIEVDPDTGELELTRYAAVDDVGRCVNPMIVEGQIHGAVAQGVGQALSELFYCDPQTGQPLTGSFMDYAIPRASALPRLDTEIIEVLSPTNPLGIKAGGEGGTTPALAVIVSAVLDALKPLGVRDIEMPVTPIRIWQAIQDARGGGTR